MPGGGQVTAAQLQQMAQSNQIASGANGSAIANALQTGTYNPQFSSPGSAPNPGPGNSNPSSGMDLSGLNALGSQVSGVTQAQLAQQKQEFDAQLQFAQQQMQQLGIPQLQINQQLAQLQQQQFQAQLALATQNQQYTQNYQNAQLTGWLYPTTPVPNTSSMTGGIGSGGTSWNALSQYAQQLAGSSYNDQAGKAAFAQTLGLTPNNMNGSTGQNLNQSQINAVLQAAGVSPAQLGGGAVGAGGVTWNQLSNLLQQSAGSSYNDAAGKQAFMNAVGANQNNFSGSNETLSDQNALNSIVSAATGGRLQSYGQLSGAPAISQPGGTGQTPTAGTAGYSQGAMMPASAPTGAYSQQAPNPNQPQQTLQGQAQQATLSGMYQGAPTEAAREFNATLGLQQGQLGQQYLATAAQLQGPQNTFQLQNYLQGAQGNPNVPTYLQNLASNTQTPTFQQAGSTPPTVQSAQGLTSQMGYGVSNPFQVAGQQSQNGGQQSSSPGWDVNQTQQTLRGMMGNAQGLAPGSIEQLNSDQLAALGSGLGSVGGSLPSFLQQYANSRVGQTAPIAQTRMA